MRKKKFTILIVMLIGLTLLLSGCWWDKTYKASGKVTDKGGEAIPNIKIVASGGVNATTKTNKSGGWTLTDLKDKVTIKATNQSWKFDPGKKVISKEATLNFKGYKRFSLTIKTVGSGSVNIEPEKDKYIPGEKVTLTATKETFDYWEGIDNTAVVGEYQIPITMDKSKTITAHFIDDGTEKINFEDEDLRMAVLKALGRTKGAITTEDVKKLTNLDVSARQIESLAGLEHLTALISLNLDRTGVQDISNLSVLSKLVNLNLAANKVNKVTPVSKLKNLTEVDMSKNQITSIKDLKWLGGKNLTTLDLSGNRISSIAALNEISTLEVLNLNGNDVSDIGPLAELKDLTRLYLNNNAIKDITNFNQRLPKIQVIDLSDNNLTSIKKLSIQYNTLKELDLTNNVIEDVSPLNSMTSLNKLNLSKNLIKNIAKLGDLAQLTELNLSYNKISDLSALANLINLKKLYLHNNQLSDLTPIRDLTNLEEVTLMGNDDTLDLSTGTEAHSVVQELVNQGTTVRYKYESNSSPQLGSIGDKTVDENSSLIFTVHAADPDGDEITLNAKGDLVSNFNPSTGKFAWIPDYNASGTYQITFSVSDGQVMDSETITITVNNVNRPPEFKELQDYEVVEANNLNFSIEAVDPDGQVVKHTVSGDSIVVNEVDQAALTFDWTPGYDAAQMYLLTVTATDGDLTVEKTINITVENFDRPPDIDPIGNKTVTEKEKLEFTVSADDKDGDNIIYDISCPVNPEIEDAFNPETQVFSWTPSYFAAPGENTDYAVEFIATGSEKSATKEITITVENVDRPPEFTSIGGETDWESVDFTVDEYSELRLDIVGHDPDKEDITYKVDSGLTLEPEYQPTIEKESQLVWTPPEKVIGLQTLTIEATANGKTITEQITVDVKNLEFAPEFDDVDSTLLTVDENETMQFTASATDMDSADTLSYSIDLADTSDKIENKLNESKATFDIATGDFSWTTDYDDAGSYQLAIQVTDGMHTVEKTFELTVNNVDREPHFTNTLSDEVVSPSDIIMFTVPEAKDDDGDTITYSYNVTSGSLPGATFDDVTREFVWEPTAEDIGTYNVEFIAKSNDKQDEITMTITVDGYRLEVTNPLTLDNNPIEEDDTGQASITFENVGNKASTDFDVQWEVKDTTTNTIVDSTIENHTGLADSSSITSNYNINGNLGAGEYQILVTIDPIDDEGNHIEETLDFNIIVPKVKLIVKVTGVGDAIGSVDVNGDETVAVDNTIDVTYDVGTQVTLTPSTELGNYFSGWIPDTSDSFTDINSNSIKQQNPLIFELTDSNDDGVMTITAEFRELNLGSELTFLSDREGTTSTNIYRLSSGAKQLDNLTSSLTGDVTSAPDWSPGSVSYSKYLFEAVDGNSGIYIWKDGAITFEKTSTSQDFLKPVWSPGGGKIAFISEELDGSYQLYYMDYKGDGLTKLTTDGVDEEYAPTWSQSNNHIVYVGTDGHLYMVDLNNISAGPTNLTSSYAAGNCKDPTWSSDDTMIAFESGQDIWYLELDGSYNVTNAEQVTSTFAYESKPSWSWDSTHLAYISSQSGDANVWKYEISGTSTQLTSNLTGSKPTPESFPVWSFDDTMIAFVSKKDMNKDIFVVTADETNSIEYQVTYNESNDFHPVWGP